MLIDEKPNWPGRVKAAMYECESEPELGGMARGPMHLPAFFLGGGYTRAEKVSHWMPLPEPPCGF